MSGADWATAWTAHTAADGAPAVDTPRLPTDAAGVPTGGPALPPRVLEDGDRYVIGDMVGRGGMGEVWRVHDGVLGRALVRKVLRQGLRSDAFAVRRFTNEARITAHLQHPGVVPVVDIGLLPDGRPFWTMQEVRGPRLTDVLLLARHRPDEWPLHRLVDLVRRVAEVVAFAHSRGVLHRDIKPDNVMVGEFGTVLLLDWGIARASAPLGEEAFPGQIVGTFTHIAPETARNEVARCGPWSDVFLLGGLLHEVLSGRPPREGPEALARAGREPVAPLAGSIDPRLAAVCRDALAFVPEDRPPTAAPVAAALAAWLEGRQRRVQALAIVGEAERARRAAEAVAQEAAVVLAQASAVLGPLRPFDADVHKRPGWALEDRAAALRVEAGLSEDEHEQALQAALRVDPELPEAHRALAELYRDRHGRAEQLGDDGATRRWERRLRQHDRGEHAAWLAGVGRLTLRTEPPGAVVGLHRFVAEHRRLVPVEERVLGTTPLVDVHLPIGSYLLTVDHPDRAPVRCPVRITRTGHWDGSVPAGAGGGVVYLPRPDEVPDGFCYVPAGPCELGGDPDAADGLPPRRGWTDGFVIGRHPVTHGAFVAFLNGLVDGGRADEAARWAPLHDAAAGTPDQRGYRVDAQGRYRLDVGEVETPWTLDGPVVNVTWQAARAFCAAQGPGWRLPHSVEWEKAARGGDARPLPWGWFFEPTWANTVHATAGRPAVCSVHAFALDESPYGVRGLVGNVRDLCLDPWLREGPKRTVCGPDTLVWPAQDTAWINVRGGAANSTGSMVRPASRLASQPDQPFPNVGFRLARSLTGHPG